MINENVIVKREVYSLIRKLYTTMLRYHMSMHYQEPYMVKDIREYYRELQDYVKLIPEVYLFVTDELLDEIYSDALKGALYDTNKPKEIFPKNRIDYYLKEDIFSYDEMEMFLRMYAFAPSVRRMVL